MSTIFKEMNKEYRGSRPEVIALIPKNAKKVLDVGCSSGEFGYALKHQGIEVWGVEPVVESADLANKVLDKVINGLFVPGSPIPDNFFDVVTFNDSLEHFPDPMPPLTLAKAKLKDDGLLICSIPNVRYIENLKNLLLNKDWKYEESGILDKTHLRFFTAKSMVRTIEEAGYKVISVLGVNPFGESGWKTKAFTKFFFWWADDVKYYQYVVVAKKYQGE